MAKKKKQVKANVARNHSFSGIGYSFVYVGNVCISAWCLQQSHQLS
jgi:RNA recognition motif-containing protein